MQNQLEKEIQFKVIDQLHNAVIQISGVCFELKKFCISIIFIAVTLIVTFTSKNLDNFIFLAIYTIIFSFWLVDSIAYYYQVKLRSAIDLKLKKIREACSAESVENGEDTIEDSRVNKSKLRILIDSFINYSMFVYLILFILNSIIFGLFLAKSITSY